MSKVQPIMTPPYLEITYVPEKDPNYIQWGHYDLVKSIIESGKFYPTWITGETGNGKTTMVEQVCAELGREFIRINFTTETDEMSLLGGWRLQNGDTVFEEGLIVTALRKGAVVLLDEIDAAHANRALVLQSVLEGKGVMIKATNEFVKPAKGFQIFATSNTKGRGSDDGRYAGVNVMNAAFLDRFSATIEQEYPPAEIEKNMLLRYSVSWLGSDITNENKNSPEVKERLVQIKKFVTKLMEWTAKVRENYRDQTCQENISTRTLINIIQGYTIVNDELKSIELACARYPNDIKDGFISYYKAINITEPSASEQRKAEKEYKTFN